MLAGKMLIVASADANANGIDAVTGQKIWATGLGNANYADVVAVGEQALISCTSGQLYALRPLDGGIAWQFDAGSPLRAAPAVGDGDVIYLPTCDGSVMAISVEP